MTITMATVLHIQSKSRMSLYLSLHDKFLLMTSSMKWVPVPAGTFNSGADPGFSLGGGGGGGAQKVMCQHAHYERGTELTFGRGQGPA